MGNDFDKKYKKEKEQEKDKEKNKKKPKKKKAKKIKDLKDEDGNYDIEGFKQAGVRIRGKRGKKGYRLKDGWRIEQDDAQHAGHHHQNGGGKWKLFDPNGNRVGTLDEFGKLFRD